VQQGNFGIAVGHLFKVARHKQASVHKGQLFKHGVVQHIPRADLLFNHIEAGKFCVHSDLL
jgi:hypothetical protein